MLRLLKGRIASRTALTALALLGFRLARLRDGRDFEPGSIDAPNTRHDPDRSNCDFAGDPGGDRARLLRLVRAPDLGSRRLGHFRNRPGVRLNANCELLPVRRWELAMDANELEKPLVIPLVKALTRAPTIVGVPYMYFMFEMVATSVIFFATHNLVNLLWMIPLHLFGYVMTLKDDRIFEILFVKSSKCPPRSRSFWNCDSYKV